MAREKSLHRLAVVDNLQHRNLQGIVTQSQVVKFIWENITLLGSIKYIHFLFLFLFFIILLSFLFRFYLFEMVLIFYLRLSKSVKDFPEVFHEVYTVNRKIKTLDAFQLMSDKVDK